MDRLEPPRDYRARAGQVMRWRLYVVAALKALALLGLILTIYDKRIAAWVERQNKFEKAS